MSMTFYPRDAEFITMECDYCLQARDKFTKQKHGSFDFDVALDGEWVEANAVEESRQLQVTCDPFCSGTYVDTAEPTFTVSNVNAVFVLNILDLVEFADSSGELSSGVIPYNMMAPTQRKVMRLLNSRNALTVHDGRSPERIRRYLGQLQLVIKHAALKRRGIYWA